MTTPDEVAQVSAEDAARRNLAAEIRTLAGLVMLSEQGEDSIAAASIAVRRAIAELSRSVRRGRYDGLEGLRPGSPGNERIWETHAAFGRSNPLAPPAEVEEDAGRVTGIVTFGPAWEGGPGVVYGGWIAALLDGVLGRAVISAGHLAVTRSLTVRFLRPTPLLRELTVESAAGSRVGREVPVRGRLRDGEIVTCEAEATFACVEVDRYRAKPS
jgi:acyl-coenzyme A thioesterase PaaI-like protein